ncbi:MAG: hypothetical protein ABSB22_08985 [Thermodesulfobacteriota bacterium]|jgi:hypothetical protein
MMKRGGNYSSWWRLENLEGMTDMSTLDLKKIVEALSRVQEKRIDYCI